MEKEEIIVAEKQTEILLESGTNELELLEFMVGTQHYGINVAKIRELCQYQTPTPVPNAHPFIEGIFMPRDMLITVINLSKALGITELGDTSQDMYIITNFNNLHTAFHVQKVQNPIRRSVLQERVLRQESQKLMEELLSYLISRRLYRRSIRKPV